MSTETFDGLARKLENDAKEKVDRLFDSQPPTPIKGLPRNPYKIGTLRLTTEECSWLAAIIDGEGSVRIGTYERKSGSKIGKPVTVLSVTVCYNTNWGILAKAISLVPWANIHKCVPSGFNTSSTPKECYGVETAQRSLIYDLLNQVLPYMSHTSKIANAREILAYIETYSKVKYV